MPVAWFIDPSGTESVSQFNLRERPPKTLHSIEILPL
jgi:hypothetical protein